MGTDLMRNKMDLGPIYNTRDINDGKVINIDNPNYTNPVAIKKK